MPEVGGHRLAHEEEREDEDGEAVEADGRVREGDRAADRAEGDVVRQEPREALVPDAPPLVVPFERHGAREEPRVDDEVRAAGDQAGRGDDELARRACRLEPMLKTAAAASEARLSAPMLKQSVVPGVAA